MDTALLDYYQGSLATPDGFKGFMPGATKTELTYICSNIPHPQTYTECQVTPAAIPAASLPTVGSSTTSELMVLIIGSTLVWLGMKLINHIKEIVR